MTQPISPDKSAGDRDSKKWALNDKIDDCACIAGDEPGWNYRYRRALEAHNLKLRTYDGRRLQPHQIMAPIPHGEDASTWPQSYIEEG